MVRSRDCNPLGWRLVFHASALSWSPPLSPPWAFPFPRRGGRIWQVFLWFSFVALCFSPSCTAVYLTTSFAGVEIGKQEVELPPLRAAWNSNNLDWSLTAQPTFVICHIFLSLKLLGCIITRELTPLISHVFIYIYIFFFAVWKHSRFKWKPGSVPAHHFSCVFWVPEE